MNISKIWSAALHFIAPPFCRACRIILSESQVFCVSCSEDVKPVLTLQVPLTNTRTVRVFAVGNYTDPLARFIKLKQYGDVTAAYQLGELMWHYTPINALPFDYLVPVPLHWTRYAWRGFNQSYEAASALSNMSGIPIASIVRRVIRTQYQSRLSAKERMHNVHNAFELISNDAIFKYKRLLIVDDLFTTGATVTQLAKTLLPLRPLSIDVIVGARVI